MVAIGSKYEETKSVLVEKLNDPSSIEVLVSEGVSNGHACYFCEGKIPDGDVAFELEYRFVYGNGRFGRGRYFVDADCMREIRDRNK